jgi:hypothetical protein
MSMDPCLFTHAHLHYFTPELLYISSIFCPLSSSYELISITVVSSLSFQVSGKKVTQYYFLILLIRFGKEICICPSAHIIFIYLIFLFLSKIYYWERSDLFPQNMQTNDFKPPCWWLLSRYIEIQSSRFFKVYGPLLKDRLLVKSNTKIAAVASLR